MNFTLHMLETITKNFSEDHKVGSGGYADIYKAVYAGKEIAVKRLHQLQGLDDKEFENEYRNLSKVHHENVVKLLGFCHESRKTFVEHHGEKIFATIMERILCFEYVQGGSLEKHIKDDSCDLDWPTCYKIIKGICEGINHLHTAYQKPILHLDIKPANILLDDNKNAKISDFGLSRVLEGTLVTEDIRGTAGYMPPEYQNSGYISDKYDVFSLGVVIIKIMDGNMGLTRSIDMGAEQFIEHVYENWNKRLKAMAGHPSHEIERRLQVKKCVEIALKCVLHDWHKRPSIKDVVDELKPLEAEFTKGLSLASDDESKDTIVQTMELNILERVLAGSEEPSRLHYLLLQKITEKFSKHKKIGVGGCGEVYKGTLQNGDVAVKRLFKIRTTKDKMFHREVKSLIMARHQNIVRFLGYCSVTEEEAIPYQGGTIMVDIRERLLCFEYIGNGNLENHLTDELRGLEWHTRYEIIVGICRGLLYLHNEKNIIHMDLKPANILLDDLMVPKITDFGLSRLENNSQAATTTRFMSPGYCAPEYIQEGKSSSKSDIYSLGVMVLELVTGSKKDPDLTKVLRRWRHRWIKSSKDTPLNYKQVRKCLELAQRCIQINPKARPDMVYIMQELDTIDSEGHCFQEIPCLDDMLGIEPLEIHFPFELDSQISHSIELTNDTDGYIAFMMTAILRCFRIEPDKGIVPPRSKCSVTIKMQAQVKENELLYNQYKEKITVQSTIVDGGLGAMDITGDEFIEKEGTVVDVVNVTAIFDNPPSAEES